MNGKERVRAALNFEETDRPPAFASFVPEVTSRLREEIFGDTLDLGVALGNDMVKDCVGLEKSFYGGPEPSYTCPWGILWRHFRNDFGHYTEIAEYPLSGDTDKLHSYEIPDPDAPEQYASFKALLSEYGDEKWMIGSSQVSIFEAAWYLRGLDQLMMDMLVEKDYVHALMDKVMQFPLRAGLNYIELGADMVWLGDDVAMQTGMMMSVENWREFLKPRYAKIIDAFKEARPSIKVAYHSCGNCIDILDDMVEIGLDVLNPIQPLALDPLEVKKRYHGRLAMFGGVDVQNLMPRGTVEEIKAEVKRLREHCGKGGGYIVAPAHHVQADTSNQNIHAFYEAALEV